jgi:hypothetical protein
VLPACNAFANVEVAYGGAWTRQGGEQFLSARLAQAKTVFRPLQPDDWGVGATLGTTSYPKRDGANRGSGDPYLYAIVSRSFSGDGLIVHANAGVVRERDVAKTTPVWAIGSEIRMAPRVQFLPEIFHLGRGRPYYQASVRYALIEGRATVDASYGDRASSGASERWVSVGVHLDTAPFLP